VRVSALRADGVEAGRFERLGAGLGFGRRPDAVPGVVRRVGPRSLETDGGADDEETRPKAAFARPQVVIATCDPDERVRAVARSTLAMIRKPRNDDV